MEYMTAREAAEKWDISERLVQKYCAQGRIEGVIKLGVSWGIPEDAQKPVDPRRAETTPVRPLKSGGKRYPGLMPLMNTPFEPGQCEEIIKAMEEGPEKDIATAEYHYFSGRADEAVRETELYLTSQNMYIRLSACLIYAYANLSIGEIQRARYALAEVKRMLGSGGKRIARNAGGGELYKRCCGCAAASAAAGGAAAVQRIPAGTAVGAQSLCAVRAGALSVSEEGIRQEPRRRGGHLCHGSTELSDTGHIPASGGGHGLHEPA